MLSVSRFANYTALERIYKSLAPGGSLGLIWNIEDCLFIAIELLLSLLIITQDNAPKSWPPTTEWESKMQDITWTFEDSQVRIFEPLITTLAVFLVTKARLSTGVFCPERHALRLNAYSRAYKLILEIINVAAIPT